MIIPLYYKTYSEGTVLLFRVDNFARLFVEVCSHNSEIFNDLLRALCLPSTTLAT